MQFINYLLNWLYNKTQFIIMAKYFDQITGSIFLINPIVLTLQLITLLKTNNVESVSIPLWISFILLQFATALVGIKAKNFGLILSMLLSMLISGLIIGITIYKRKKYLKKGEKNG